MRWAGFAGRAGFDGTADSAGRRDDGGGAGAAVDPSGAAASVVVASSGTVGLQLTVWEQWL
ncbi:hypothetical protein PUN71_021060 [Arthrobacter sp. NQ7]|uniref:hypothetical protein n=1 Tax=Arthrobacter sp. NQ7 TaxID=3032303 RepID=UPI00240F7D36|nr:hypothetical protein [Arthrobacter sp. NQ7]MDJ0459704.1 hypothetical protein [Arthrobacter sp. NQ7]